MGLFTNNQKTIVSIDFDRINTCKEICNYCYIENMERIYPAYKAKVERNTELVKDNPINFANLINTEYSKYKKSKAKQYEKLDKLPVRIFGGGDYIPEMYPFFEALDFDFFIISKTLTEPDMREDLQKLVALPHMRSVLLSFDTHNKQNWHLCQDLWEKPKIKFAFTGTPLDMEMEKLSDKTYTVFFNTGDKKIEKEASKQFKERCPADSGELKLQAACTVCHKCWR